ncbi:MAG: redoxin domain-containing protein, partial [Candidatus Dormibacteraceae bacterium]
LTLSSVAIHSASGWRQLSEKVERPINPAPATTILLRIQLPAGSYDSLQLGDAHLSDPISVQSNQVEPVLISVAGGHPLTSGIYIGNEQLNLGLNELSGQIHQLPPFELQDQDGQRFDKSTMAGKTWVIAAFHTTCHTTCPLYTGLFLRLQAMLPPSVRLAEVTTDPTQDTPATLQQYAHQVGIGWRLATGERTQLENFWQLAGVGLSDQQLHTSTLMVIDSHGYLRSVYQGVPNLNQQLPSALATTLNPEGQRELNSHGNGWGLSQVMDTLNGVSKVVSSTSSGEASLAPTFSAPDLNGKAHSLSELHGHPILLNYFASWCSGCQQEMPLIQQAAGKRTDLRVLLIDERDDNHAGRHFLSRLGIQFTALQDPNGAIGNRYQISGLPATFFIRPDGSISSHYAGTMDQATLSSHLTDLGVN